MRASLDDDFRSFVQRLEKQPGLAWLLTALWLSVVCGIAFVWNLGSTGVVDETEPLFAEASRQMVVTGDWITPYFNQQTRFDKPPLVYWLMAIAYQTIGVNEWAVRLPSALAAIALTLFGFFTLKRFGFTSPATISADGPEMPRLPNRQRWLAAWIGAGMMALTPQTIAWARTGVSDMLLSGCIGSSLFAFFWGYTQPSRTRAKTLWYLAFYVLMALAVLTKGPVGIVLPGLIVVVFLLYVGKFREVWQEAFPLRGMVLFVAIALPWYILVYLANGQAYIDSFFGYHNFERFTSVVNRHSAPWYFYFIVVLLGFTPYSIHLPVAIARLRFWRWRHWQQQPRTSHLGIFALTWLIVIFVFFTVAVTKLPSYVLPLMPAAAILAGLFWSEQMSRLFYSAPGEQVRNRWVKVSGILQVLFLVLLAVLVPLVPRLVGKDPAMPSFREVVEASGILVWGGIAWLLTAIVGAIALLRRQGHWLWSVQLVGFALFFCISAMPVIELVDQQRQLPLRQLAAIAATEYRPGDQIAMVGFSKPSLVFYTRHPVLFLRQTQEAGQWFQQTLGRSDVPQSVLLLSYPDRILEIGLPAEQYRSLGRAGAYELVQVKMPLPPGWTPSVPVG